MQEAETDLQRGLSEGGRRMEEEEEDVCVWRRVRMGKKMEERESERLESQCVGLAVRENGLAIPMFGPLSASWTCVLRSLDTTRRRRDWLTCGRAPQ